MSRLGRFKSAQDRPFAGYRGALEEIRSGEKTGHWMWYVFPQLAGLGHSGMSRSYAIEGEAEAADYLRDPELRSRLLEITRAVAQQLEPGKAASLDMLMGSQVDALKVVSSLTLFREVARRLALAEPLDDYDAVASAANDVLMKAEAQGYPPCAYTLRRLERASSSPD